MPVLNLGLNLNILLWNLLDITVTDLLLLSLLFSLFVFLSVFLINSLEVLRFQDHFMIILNLLYSLRFDDLRCFRDHRLAEFLNYVSLVGLLCLNLSFDLGNLSVKLLLLSQILVLLRVILLLFGNFGGYWLAISWRILLNFYLK